jgi:hypothetical protein
MGHQAARSEDVALSSGFWLRTRFACSTTGPVFTMKSFRDGGKGSRVRRSAGLMP